MEITVKFVEMLAHKVKQRVQCNVKFHIVFQTFAGFGNLVRDKLNLLFILSHVWFVELKITLVITLNIQIINLSTGTFINHISNGKILRELCKDSQLKSQLNSRLIINLIYINVRRIHNELKAI